MNRLDIPFNLSLLILSDKAASLMRPVTSLDTFVGATKNFNPDGLFSTDIFGVVGTPARYQRFSYINLKTSIIHPTLFKALGQVKSLYLDILARREFAVWDPQTKDFVKSNIAEGQTGFQFFCEYLPRIQFPNNESESRQMAVALLEKFRDNVLINKLVVLPAGYREFEVDDSGRESSSEFNDYYYKLVAISNTISPSTLNASPDAYDRQRMSMQNTVMELYDLLTKVIEGKNSLLMGKMAGRKIYNGTRNVITSMNSTIRELGHPRNITMNDTLVGLYQFSKSVLPVTQQRLKDGWLAKCFSVAGAPAILCDPETLRSDAYQLRADSYSKWLSSESLEKQISYYREETIRHNPIMIEGKYLGLVYRGPDGTFAFIHGIEQLPEGRDPKDCTPITLTDLLYHSLYPVARKYKGFVTRYPITGVGSIYPSNAYLKTTIQSEERVELDPETWQPFGKDYVAFEYPVLGSSFFNSLAPHPSRLRRLGADFDGDTCSWTAVYSDDAIVENDRRFKTKAAYVGSDGRFINDNNVDTINYVISNMTGF